MVITLELTHNKPRDLISHSEYCSIMSSNHDDVIKWKDFSVLLSLCEGNHRGDRWIPLTKASDADLWCFLWYVPEKKTVEKIFETPVIWDTIYAHYDVTVMTHCACRWTSRNCGRHRDDRPACMRDRHYRVNVLQIQILSMDDRVMCAMG